MGFQYRLVPTRTAAHHPGLLLKTSNLNQSLNTSVAQLLARSPDIQQLKSVYYSQGSHHVSHGHRREEGTRSLESQEKFAFGALFEGSSGHPPGFGNQDH